MPPGWQKIFEDYKDYLNEKYNWADPDAQEYKRLVKPDFHSKDPSRNKKKEMISNYIQEAIKDGFINNREDVIKQMAKLGEVTRKNHKSISLKLEGDKKAIKYEGALFNEQFNSNFISKIREEKNREPVKSKSDRRRKAQEAYFRMGQSYKKRSEYNQHRYKIKDEEPEISIQAICDNAYNNLNSFINNNNINIEPNSLSFISNNKKIINDREFGTKDRRGKSTGIIKENEIPKSNGRDKLQNIQSKGNRKSDSFQKSQSDNFILRQKQIGVDFIYHKIKRIKNDGIRKTLTQQLRNIINSIRSTFNSEGKTDQCFERINSNLIESDKFFSKSESDIKRTISDNDKENQLILDKLIDYKNNRINKKKIKKDNNKLKRNYNFHLTP